MGHAAVVDALLDAAVSVDVVDGKSGWSPLHFAARYGHETLLRLLLSQRANLEVKSRVRQQTPLHVAVSHGQLAVALKLLQVGANAHSTDVSGVSCVQQVGLCDGLSVALEYAADTCCRS